MSTSRLIGIVAGIGAFLSAMASSVQLINPKWGAVIAAVGAGVAMFTERAGGGLSIPEKRVEAAIEQRKDEADRP